jgi:hypothetical protein
VGSGGGREGRLFAFLLIRTLSHFPHRAWMTSALAKVSAASRSLIAMIAADEWRTAKS